MKHKSDFQTYQTNVKITQSKLQTSGPTSQNIDSVSLKWDLETIFLITVSSWFRGWGATDQLLRPVALNQRGNHTKQKWLCPKSVSEDQIMRINTPLSCHTLIFHRLLIEWLCLGEAGGEKIKKNGKPYRAVNNEQTESLT